MSANTEPEATPRALHHLRAAVARGAARPAWMAGLRAAAATMVPVIIGAALPAGGATWMSLGGFNGALNDRGGSYRTRALTMIAVTVFGAAGVALGALAHPVPVAIAVTFVVAIACAIGRVWGAAGAGVGGAVLSTYLISLAVPSGGVYEATLRALFALAGGAWAMLISLVLWPLRPYRPVRRAVAAAYVAVADYADQLAARAGRGESTDAWDLRVPMVAARTAVEDARTVLTTTRLGRPGETERGERLLVLHEAAEQLFVHLLALSDTIEAVDAASRDPVVEVVLAATLSDVALSARGTADATVEEGAVPRLATMWSGEGLRAAATGATRSDPHYEHAARLLDRAAQYADMGALTAESMNGPAGAPLPNEPLPRNPVDQPPSLRDRLRQARTPGPLIVRHALRIATLCSFAVWLVARLGLHHAYWVTITIVVILQPYGGATTQRAMQRIAGTVLGAMLTAALASLLHDQFALLGLIFVFVALCVALLPVNYAAYSIFLTPAFVLLAEASAGDWHLAGLRVENTLIGGAIALIGSWILWPSREWRDFPALAAAALAANREYLRLAAATASGDADAARQLDAARRAVATAASNVEESFQRMLGEHRGSAAALKPAMTLQTFIRRFAVSAGAVALAPAAGDTAAAGALAPFVDAASALLDDLVGALTTRRLPRAYPFPGTVPIFAAPVGPVVRSRVERLMRQLKSLHDAVAEVAVAPAERA